MEIIYEILIKQCVHIKSEDLVQDVFLDLPYILRGNIVLAVKYKGEAGKRPEHWFVSGEVNFDNLSSLMEK